MNKEQLDKITEDLILNIFRNEDTIYYFNSTTFLYLLDVIASLHNLLYESVTGQRYDYMFHWTNKIGYDGLNDDIYDEVIKNV